MKKFLFAALSVLTASLSLAAVNINTASPSELEALPGIGPAKAKAIVDYRQQHGAFKSVEELKNVRHRRGYLLQTEGRSNRRSRTCQPKS